MDRKNNVVARGNFGHNSKVTFHKFQGCKRNSKEANSYWGCNLRQQITCHFSSRYK